MVKRKKSLGQHFLKEESIAQRIVGSLSGNGNYEVVVEVGPGKGVLSRYLLDLAEETWFVEVDREMVAYLEEQFPGIGEQIISRSILRLDFAAYWPGKQVAVIGNFPYNISSQILFQILAHRSQVAEMVGMFQKEVAKRIIASHGNKDYGILSVLTQLYYKGQYLFDVAPGSFIPPPQVQSGVIRLERKRTTVDCDEKLLFRVVKQAFNQRRKTLRNALRPLNTDAVPAEMLQLRAEALSPEGFVELTRLVKLPE